MKVKPKSSLYKDSIDVQKNKKFLQAQRSKKKNCFFSSKVSDDKKVCKTKFSQEMNIFPLRLKMIQKNKTLNMLNSKRNKSCLNYNYLTIVL